LADHQCCPGNLPGAALVDTRTPVQHLLGPQLVAVEYHFLRHATLFRNTQHFAGPSLVPVAHLALRPAGDLALAHLAVCTAHLDSTDVHAVAIRGDAFLGGRLRTRVQPHGGSGRRTCCVFAADLASRCGQLARLVCRDVLFTRLRNGLVGLDRAASRLARTDLP